MATVRFDTRFPGYEILSELGRSNARVLKARHLETGDLVAIKHFALNTDAETLRRFQRESTIMTNIAHPNVVRVREVQLEAELPYIVMELIEGGSLCDLLNAPARPDVSTITRLGLQMAAAFKAIHPAGIVHRDVKPANILYRLLPSGELHFLLTDFGVARLHEQSSTLTGQSLMTYEYAAPEQFNDPKGVSAATDYYALGVVLYECLFGRVPFALNDHAGIVTFMHEVLNQTPPALAAPDDEPALRGFRTLLEGLLQKKSVDRISDPDELTWLLKQAELTYLQASRTRLAPDTAVTSGGAGPVKPRTEYLSAEPVANEPAVPAGKKSRRPGAGVWVAVTLVGLLGVFGLYYVATRDADIPINGSKGFTPTDVSSNTLGGAETPAEAVADSLARYQAEEAQRREKLRQEARGAARDLSVELTNYRVGLFGGVKEVRLTLDNPSDLMFASVTVQINYYKESGGLYKSESVDFTNVKPHSTPVLRGPDSDRGTRLTCKIVAHQFTSELDSLMRIVPTDTLP